MFRQPERQSASNALPTPQRPYFLIAPGSKSPLFAAGYA